MGQYYQPCVLNEEKTRVISATNPLSWDSGMKLMEHSYYGVDVVRAAVELLKTKYNGYRFVWAGDYADENADGKNFYVMACDKDLFKFEEELETTSEPCPWDKSQKVYSLPEPFGEAKYLLNYDKKVAVELVPDEESEWPIHPLPLLTAESNGKGGGDYFSEVNASLVGSWKYDHLGAADEVPEGFEVETAIFRED